MPLNKNFNNVVTQKKQNKRQITKLAELNQDDKNTIYNLIFTQSQTETKEEQRKGGDIMATIILYADKVKQMPGLIQDVKKAVNNYNSELFSLNTKSFKLFINSLLYRNSFSLLYYH